MCIKGASALKYLISISRLSQTTLDSKSLINTHCIYEHLLMLRKIIFSAILSSSYLHLICIWAQHGFKNAHSPRLCFSFCRTLSYSSLIKDYKTLRHYLQHEIILTFYYLVGGRKQAVAQLLIPTMSVNMSVYRGASTVVTALKLKSTRRKSSWHRLKSSD